MSWFEVKNVEDALEADLLTLVEKGTGKRINSGRFIVITDQSEGGELIYDVDKNYYVLFSNLNAGKSHIEKIWGIKIPN